MIEAARRLMCDKFSVLCTLAELNEKQLREDERMQVRIKRLREDAVIPSYAHETDAGFDLYAAEDVIIEPGETALVPTGIAIDIPQGYEIQLRPRSGITRMTKLRVQLGTIDAGYRGDIGVIVDNIYPEVNVLNGSTARLKAERTYRINKGDRIAQAVLAPIAQAAFAQVEEFDGDTERGENGFGSSGVRSSYNKAVEVNGAALDKLAKDDRE